MVAGIVSKTSLKIYSDPFEYYQFLKSCLTHLIDSGGIPDNERLNIQPKRPRRISINQDEIVAFMCVKNMFVSLNRSQFDAELCAAFHSSVVIRAKVKQVLQFWQTAGKVCLSVCECVGVCMWTDVSVCL